MASAGQLRKLRQDVNNLAKENKELAEDLDRARSHAGQSEAHLERLRQAVAVLGTVPDMNDAEVQCKMRGGAINGPFKMGKGQEGKKSDTPPADFKFLPRDRKVNWKLLQRVNIRKLMMNNDTTTICQLLEEVMFADIDSESVFNLTEGNLIKIFQLAQLMLEYINHERRVLEHQFDDFVENRELVLQLLERTGVASLGDVRDWTSELGRNFQGLAGRELEDMFGQVRLEERAMSRMVLAGAIEETKRRYEKEVEEEQLLGEQGGSSEDEITGE